MTLIDVNMCNKFKSRTICAINLQQSVGELFVDKT